MARPPTFSTLVSVPAARSALTPRHAPAAGADDGTLRLAAFALLVVALGALAPPLLLTGRRPA